MRRVVLLLAAALLALASPATAQQSILQGGSWTAGHGLMYTAPTGGQPIAQDAGGAAGGVTGVNPFERGLTLRGTGSAPFANAGSGPLSTNDCNYDGPTTGPNHYLCFSANAQGGGLIAYGAAGGASALPLSLNINGAVTTIPAGGLITGPGSATSGHLATWGTYPEILDGGAVPSVVAGTGLSVIGGPAYTVSLTSSGMTFGAQTVSLGGSATVQGAGGKIQLASGTATNGHCVQFDASGNTVDAGGSCTTGGGGGTVSSGLINQLAWYAAGGTTVSGLTTANSGVLITSAGGVPSIATTLPASLTIPTATLTSPTISGATISTSSLASPTFTGTVAGAGTVPNAVLVNSGTTVNGQVCTLGSSCVVSATSAASLAAQAATFMRNFGGI